MTHKRLSKDTAAFLFVDHQTGLSNGVQDQSQPEYMAAVTGLAETAKAFGMPAVITTSAADGPNGPVLPVIEELLPEASVVARPGEINAWDNENFVKAVKETGRKQLIVADVSTEVCAAFVALSALEEGYEVYVVVDASGTWNKLTQEIAVQRITQAGAIPMTWVAVAAELQRDWRAEGAGELGRIMGTYLPFYGNLAASYQAVQAENS